MKPISPKPSPADALLEWDEAQETEAAIQNTLWYGTDDPKRVAQLEAELDAHYVESYEDAWGVQDRPSDYALYELDDYDPYLDDEY